MARPVVSVIMGSQSDLEIVKEALEVLRSFKIAFEAKILSAHRTPRELASYVESCPKKGIKVFIAAAGGAAALAGVVAAHSILPVIGILIVLKFALPHLWGFLIMLQLSMPSATSLSVIIRRFNKPDALISQGIFFSHIIGLFTIPLFLSLYLSLVMLK